MKMEDYQQPGQGQPQWQQYPQPPQPPKNSNNGFCIAAMVLGICSLVLVCVPFIPIATGVVGIVMSVMGLKSKGAMQGMAIAGLVTSILAVVFVLIFVLGLNEFGLNACYGCRHVPGF